MVRKFFARFYSVTILNVKGKTIMSHLTRAHQELFTREPDECFDNLNDLVVHCEQQRSESQELWWPVDSLRAEGLNPHELLLTGSDDRQLRLNDWSFSQLCGLCGVHKGTVNRLRSDTASQVFHETLPRSGKPLQLLATGDHVRAIHGVSYTRLYNAELLDAVLTAAPGFEPPPRAFNGATGLYCGEQDLFAFLIDPNGWIDIHGEQFAPGLFCWNSEVGRRSLGVQTFWYQRICGNHIVWDVTDVNEFTRKHTANVRESLEVIRSMVHELAKKRDERRSGFVSVVERAMGTRLATTSDATINEITRHGFTRSLAEQAVTSAEQTSGGLTIFAIVDALTRLTQKAAYAGDRAALDQKAGALLSLAV